MDFEKAELVLAQSANHRVLKRVPPLSEWSLRNPPAANDIRRAIYVDVESTGLNQDQDEVIELALLPFDYVRDTGEIVRVFEDEAFNAFRQPSFPIPTDSTKIHGIRDADVAGHDIDTAEVERRVRGAQLIVAHNAGFDRPMVEKHWPVFADLNWACSLADIRWQDEGLGSGKLDYLLMRQGWFYDGHRALNDALAGVFLLSRQLPVSGAPAMAALLECARRPLRAVRAEGAPFEARAALKQRGYRWDPGNETRSKAWWVVTEDPDGEVAWLGEEIYGGAPSARVVPMPATRRYSARIWS